VTGLRIRALIRCRSSGTVSGIRSASRSALCSCGAVAARYGGGHVRRRGLAAAPGVRQAETGCRVRPRQGRRVQVLLRGLNALVATISTPDAAASKTRRSPSGFGQRAIAPTSSGRNPLGRRLGFGRGQRLPTGVGVTSIGRLRPIPPNARPWSQSWSHSFTYGPGCCGTRISNQDRWTPAVRPGPSIVALKIGRSAVRPRPWPPSLSPG
jgi:hypothetical protein